MATDLGTDETDGLFVRRTGKPSASSAKKSVAIFGLLLSLLVALTLVLPVYASPTGASSNIETMRQQQQTLDRDRQNVSRERDRLSNLESAAQERLNGLQRNLETTSVQIQDSDFQLKLAQTRLEELQADLAAAESNYLQHQAATVARLRFLQRSSISHGWAVLLESQNLSDFLNRRRQLKLVYQSDKQILANLTQEARSIDQQKNDVEQQKNEVALVREQLLGQKADFEGQAEAQRQMIQRLNSDRVAMAAAVDQLARDSESLGQLIQQRVAEQRAREEAAAKDRGRSSIVIRGTGQLGYPCNAPTTSSFGWRIHPILGYSRFHSGLDFGATYGSTIRAADTGTVILAGWYGGYGKAVVIDHGKGITTLYGHTSEIYVSEGQVVQRGQAIAAVGSTGLSTGPHLHFEVRLNGAPMDPVSYL